MKDIKFRLYSKNDKCFITASSDRKINLNGQIYADWLNVTDRYVIERFAGFKDNEVREVYEGDILDVHIFGFNGHETEHEFRCVVEWNSEWHGFALKVINESSTLETGVDYPIWAINGIHDESFQIVGNIHENPELLTEMRVSQ